MFLQHWQIAAAFDAAKQKDPKSLVGSRVCYSFCHKAKDGRKEGICGLYAWIYEHKNPSDPITEPMELTLAFDTTIDEFYVTQEVKALFAREQLLPEATTINEAARSIEIDDVIFGVDSEGE